MALPILAIASLAANYLQNQNKGTQPLRAGQINKTQQSTAGVQSLAGGALSAFGGSKGQAASTVLGAAGSSGQGQTSVPQPESTAMTRRMELNSGDNLVKLQQSLKAIPYVSQDPEQRRSMADTILMAQMAEEQRRKQGRA